MRRRSIDWETILADAGVAETTWLGPVPYAEVRHLLADAGISRLLTDPDGVPVEAGAAVRTVPAGLEGRLSLDNAALGCRRHHRRYDSHGGTITWTNGRPTLSWPNQQTRRPPP